MGNTSSTSSRKKRKKKYFTVAETLWKIGAPILVAVAKTVIEGKVPYIR